MVSTPTIHALAGEAYDAFTTIQRGDDKIVTLKDDRPEWVYDLVWSAHGAFFPDDWRYAAIRAALGAIHDDEPDELDDYAGEWADSHVDVYTMARLQWLASNLMRAEYCDTAREEFGPADCLTDQIGQGQYVESLEVFGAVADALQSRLDDLAGEEA